MLIGVDGNEANISQRVGIGQFAFQVLNQFYQSNYQKFRIYLKNQPSALTALPKRSGHWEYRTFGPRPFWTQLALPFKLKAEHFRPDVFFSPTHYAPRFCPIPYVVSVMDLSFLFYPDQFKRRDLYQLRLWTRYSVRHAAKIIVISESTGRDVCRIYQRRPEDVIIAYPGYDREKYHKEVKNQKSKIKSIKKKYGVSGDYLISIGTLQPRKNYLCLIEAFAQLLKSTSKLDSLAGAPSLVIVGKRGWLEKPIFKKIADLNLGSRVITPGFVAEEDLPYLLAGAEIFCLISLYEGFGLPVLEAMAVGVPTVLAKTSSLPEVGGKAAIYVDPLDSAALAGVLVELLSNEKRRRELTWQGFKNIARFSWESCADKIMETLELVSGS